MADTKENVNDENPDVVALVNSEKITRKELDSFVRQVATIQKLSVPDKQTEEGKEFERRILDQMVNDVLLHQDAGNQGITMSKEEIDSQYLAIANQVGGEEKLNQAFEKTGTTSDNLRNELIRQGVIEKYLNFVKEKNEIMAADEEVKEFYDKQVACQRPDLTFDAVEPQIRQVIERQKLSLPIAEIIKNLRQEAEIEISL